MTINTVSIVFFVIAAVSLLVAIYAFIRFNIPQVIGELSGRTARKSIAQMRDKNNKTGNKAHRPSPSAIERGTLTDKIEGKSKTSKAEKNAEKNAAKKADPNATVPLSNNSDATELLADDETTVLSNAEAQSNVSQNAKIDGFKVIKSIVLIHTNETI